MNKYAYKLGFLAALQDVGLTKSSGAFGFDLPPAEQLERATPRFSQSGFQSPKAFREHQKERLNLANAINTGIKHVQQQGLPPSKVNVQVPSAILEPSKGWQEFMRSLGPKEQKPAPVSAPKPAEQAQGRRSVEPKTPTHKPLEETAVAQAPTQKKPPPAPTSTVAEMLSGIGKAEIPTLREPSSARSIRY